LLPFVLFVSSSAMKLFLGCLEDAPKGPLQTDGVLSRDKILEFFED
jgi:hypothetical protein